MKIKNFVLPTFALGTAAMLLVPTEETNAFTTIGGSLSTSQRDVRVFDNWQDGQAMNNGVRERPVPRLAKLRHGHLEGHRRMGLPPARRRQR